MHCIKKEDNITKLEFLQEYIFTPMLAIHVANKECQLANSGSLI